MQLRVLMKARRKHEENAFDTIKCCHLCGRLPAAAGTVAFNRKYIASSFSGHYNATDAWHLIEF